MGKIVSKVTDAVGLTDSKAGGRAAEATSVAANTAAAAQMEALDFMKSQSALPTEIRDQSLRQLQGIFSSPTGIIDFQNSMSQAISGNPFYQNRLGQMEEATLRNASATGSLRGGQAISDVASVQNNLLSQLTNQATGAQLGGMQSLAGLNTNTNQIANIMGQIGQTQAQGITGAAQAQAAGNQQNISNLMGLGQLGIGGAMAFSDERLKKNIKKISSTLNPAINKYSWTWNDKANQLGMVGSDAGYLAGEIKSQYPELVSEHSSGYNQINTQGVERKLTELK